MHLVFNDGTKIGLQAINNPVEIAIRAMLKHLQHVDLPFRSWDNPYYLDTVCYENLIDQLIMHAHRLGITVEKQRCLDRDDVYYNSLHKIYENNYNGDPQWLDYHENIHLCQRFFYKNKKNVTVLDWREKAGLLCKNFDTAWNQYAQTQIKQGDVYVEWNELGKTPYQYWREQEPDSLVRVVDLIKPWTKLKPKLSVAMHDIDFIDRSRMDQFLDWWKQYQSQWCQQHNLAEWTVENMGVIGVYRIDRFEHFAHALKNKNHPVKISL